MSEGIRKPETTPAAGVKAVVRLGRQGRWNTQDFGLGSVGVRSIVLSQGFKTELYTEGLDDRSLS